MYATEKLTWHELLSVLFVSRPRQDKSYSQTMNLVSPHIPWVWCGRNEHGMENSTNGIESLANRKPFLSPIYPESQRNLSQDHSCDVKCKSYSSSKMRAVGSYASRHRRIRAKFHNQAPAIRRENESSIISGEPRGVPDTICSHHFPEAQSLIPNFLSNPTMIV